MFTQGPQQEYSEQDTSETSDAQQAKRTKKNTSNKYFYYGVALSIFMICYFMSTSEYEQELKFARERQQKKDAEEIFKDA